MSPTSSAPYLIDTNVVSEMAKAAPDPRVEAWLRSVLIEDLFLSVLTVGEIASGIVRRPPGRQRDGFTDWLAALERQYAHRILPIDRNVAHRWGVLTGEARARGTPLPVIDSLLAATALEHHLVIATRNVADFARTGARIHNPWE